MQISKFRRLSPIYWVKCWLIAKKARKEGALRIRGAVDYETIQLWKKHIYYANLKQQKEVLVQGEQGAGR